MSAKGSTLVLLTEEPIDSVLFKLGIWIVLLIVVIMILMYFLYGPKNKVTVEDLYNDRNWSKKLDELIKVKEGLVVNHPYTDIVEIVGNSENGSHLYDYMDRRGHLMSHEPRESAFLNRDSYHMIGDYFNRI